MRTCTKCKSTKPIEKFHRDCTQPTGRKWICATCCNKASLDYHHRTRRSITKHGITVEQYNEMLVNQDGHCYLCPTTSGLVIDHDHACCPRTYSCGKCIRGLACRRHNGFDDDTDELRRVADFKDAWRKEHLIG